MLKNNNHDTYLAIIVLVFFVVLFSMEKNNDIINVRK